MTSIYVSTPRATQPKRRAKTKTEKPSAEASSSAPPTPRPSDAPSCYIDSLLCITTNPDDSIEVHLLDCTEILAPALCCKNLRPPSSLNRSIDASIVTEETAANTSGEGESILSSLTGSPQTLGSYEDIPEEEEDGMNDVPIGEADNLSGWMPNAISNIWGSVVSYPSNMQCWEDSSSTQDTLLRSTGSSSRSRCSNPKTSARNPNRDRTRVSATQKLNSALELRRTLLKEFICSETNKEQVQKQEYELHKIKKESSFAVSKLSILHREYDSPKHQEASCDTTKEQGGKKSYMVEPLVGRELFRMLGSNSKHSFGDRTSRAKQISGMLINDDDSVETGKVSMADTVEENNVGRGGSGVVNPGSMEVIKPDSEASFD